MKTCEQLTNEFNKNLGKCNRIFKRTATVVAKGSARVNSPWRSWSSKKVPAKGKVIKEPEKAQPAGAVTIVVVV